MQILRTNSDHPVFQLLAAELELDLKIRDGEEHAWYANLNKVDRLDQVVLVLTDGEPAGCGAIRYYSNDSMEIKRMYVRPAFRGSGIASAILNELEKWAVSLRARTCVLETGLNQPEAIAFYKKNNYRPIPKFGPYKASDNSVCFEKSLS